MTWLDVEVAVGWFSFATVVAVGWAFMWGVGSRLLSFARRILS